MAKNLSINIRSRFVHADCQECSFCSITTSPLSSTISPRPPHRCGIPLEWHIT
jgi:hypothetical protein